MKSTSQRETQLPKSVWNAAALGEHTRPRVSGVGALADDCTAPDLLSQVGWEQRSLGTRGLGRGRPLQTREGACAPQLGELGVRERGQSKHVA